MGWVSMSEDIEEIRQQRAHFKKGFDNLKKRAAKSKFADLKSAQSKLGDLSKQVNCFLQEMQEQALRVFDEAEARLSDPSVRIVARLDKTTAELATSRDDLRQAELDLSKSRQANQKLRAQLNDALAELNRLRAEINSLKDNELAWNKEIRGVRRR